MRVQNTFRTRCLAIIVVLLAVVATPAVLFAHARLVRSTPSANATLTTSPTVLSLWFSEAPELKFTTLQLADSSGTAFPLGALSKTAGDAMGVTSQITGVLAAGTYTVVWHTAAADGHATNGKFSFVVAAQAGAPPVVVHVMPSKSRVIPTNAIVQTTPRPTFSTALRWAELVTFLILIGCVVFRLVVLQNSGLPTAIAADSGERARRLGYGALTLFAVTTLTRLSAQADLLPTAANGRMTAMLTVAQGTSWGHGWLMGAGGAFVCLVGLAWARWTIVGWVVAGVGVIAIGGSEAFTGHAGASTHYLPLAVSVDVAHLLGAGCWLGGLAAVMMVGFPALKPLGDVERARAGSRIVRAFHSTAVESVSIVLLTALIAAWLRLGTLAALWTTPYGTILLLKIALVVIVLGFGWYHRRTAVIPEWDHDSSFRFQRSAAAELLIGAIVVAVTAVLVSTALPTQ